jgi:hypothetical protein
MIDEAMIEASYMPQGARLHATERVERIHKNAGSTEEEGSMPTA